MPASKSHSFTSTLEKSGNRLWGAHFVVPSKVVKALSEKTSRRVHCTLNGVEEYQCAMLPQANGSHVISVNATLRKKLHLSFGDPIDVVLKKDASTYGLPMPDELEELLRQDKVGNKLIHALTPGKRRTLLYIVGSVKNPDVRAVRAAIVIRHLKANDGAINYRQLYQEMKLSKSSRRSSPPHV